MKKVLITGAQGFIGFHLCKKLLQMGYYVIGVDSSYSNISSWPEDSDKIMKRIKNDRLLILQTYKNFRFMNESISSISLSNIEGPISIVNLAARAGIPFSKQKPIFYECDNTLNFAKLLYNTRDIKIDNFVYASSSSVYGGNDTPTGCTENMKLNPLNIYAATKMYNETQAKIYGEMYNIPVTGLRFFTVYGTMGRVDMVFFRWLSAIMKNEPVLLNNGGDLYRDFTHVSDIVSGIILALEKPQKYKIYNLGRGESVRIIDLLSIIEKYVGKKAEVKVMPYPQGEVKTSLSNIELAKIELGFNPLVSIDEGTKKYIEWFVKYFA